ncbi:MAG: hypothetical protein QW666_01065 [Candidatus Woesearchaeota archaeon]
MSWIEKIAETRRKYIKIEFALLISLLLLISLFISRPEIIGYASTNIHSQPLHLIITESKSYYLYSDFPVRLTSISLSGKITGKGTVTTYLNNERGTSNLVFTNIKKASSRINQITGSIPTIGGFYQFTRGVSGLSVTGDALPAKQSPPTLKIIEAGTLYGFEALPPGYLTISGLFNYACVDSCILSEKSFTGTRFRLDFYVQPGTELEIDELIYTTYNAN